VSGQLHAPVASPPGKTHLITHCTGGWVGPRAGLDACEKSRPHRDFFPVHSVFTICQYQYIICQYQYIYYVSTNTLCQYQYIYYMSVQIHYVSTNTLYQYQYIICQYQYIMSVLIYLLYVSTNTLYVSTNTFNAINKRGLFQCFQLPMDCSFSAHLMFTHCPI
jgi:hypothetical protein